MLAADCECRGRNEICACSPGHSAHGLGAKPTDVNTRVPLAGQRRSGGARSRILKKTLHEMPGWKTSRRSQENEPYQQ
jgi:hypothetical protein